MAKRKNQRATGHAANLGDHAGPDANKEAIEKLAAAAAAENAKRTHNSEPTDEAIQRVANAVEVALIEIDTASRVMQKARADLGVARKTGKTDLGSKAWVDSVVASVKLKRAAAKGGAGEIVTEHRQMGRVLRLLDTPLGHQFKLFEMPSDATEPGTTSTIDAELQGDAAWRNNEPISNNPFLQGTENFVLWEAGFNAAMAAHANKMGPNGSGESAH